MSKSITGSIRIGSCVCVGYDDGSVRQVQLSNESDAEFVHNLTDTFRYGKLEINEPDTDVKYDIKTESTPVEVMMIQMLMHSLGANDIDCVVELLNVGQLTDKVKLFVTTVGDKSSTKNLLDFEHHELLELKEGTVTRIDIETKPYTSPMIIRVTSTHNDTLSKGISKVLKI